MPRKIRIDFDSLEMALNDHGYEAEHFLDLQTGKVLTNYEDAEPPDKELEKQDEFEGPFIADYTDVLNADPDRYFAIPGIPSGIGFEYMESFALEHAAGKARVSLLNALEKRKPFRSFKDALHYYPNLLDEWYKYKKQRIWEYAEDWLRINNIEADLYKPVRKPPAS